MTENEMKNDLKQIVESLSSLLNDLVYFNGKENEKEKLYNKLYNEITKKASKKIKLDIGYTPVNKKYHRQIEKVCDSFKNAKDAYEKKDFHSFKLKTGQAINILCEIINR